MLFLVENECEFLTSLRKRLRLSACGPGDASLNPGKVIKMAESIISWL